MTRRKFGTEMEALEWRLKKLETEYNSTNELAVVKRNKLENKAAKVMEKIEVLKSMPAGA